MGEPATSRNTHRRMVFFAATAIALATLVVPARAEPIIRCPEEAPTVTHLQEWSPGALPPAMCGPGIRV